VGWPIGYTVGGLVKGLWDGFRDTLRFRVGRKLGEAVGLRIFDGRLVLKGVVTAVGVAVGIYFRFLEGEKVGSLMGSIVPFRVLVGEDRVSAANPFADFGSKKWVGKVQLGGRNGRHKLFLSQFPEQQGSFSQDLKLKEQKWLSFKSSRGTHRDEYFPFSTRNSLLH